MAEGDVVAWLDLYDQIIASAASHAPAERLTEAALVGASVRRRRAFDGVAPVVGLAGGTGSGKSSLLNALAGEEVSPTGAQRPTTAEPFAWVPVRLAPRLLRLWTQLGIGDVVTHDRIPEIVIIDLPDIDSVERQHRELVTWLLSDLDRVLWVLDPEKYRDRVLHEQYLRPRAASGSRFRFVLNQIDRLSETELQAVTTDLGEALAGDGFVDAQVWLVAADPPVGPALGIEELWEAIAVDLKTLDDGTQRARTELAEGIKMLEPLVAPVGFGPRWDAVRVEAASRWAQSTGEGVRTLMSFVQDLSFEAPEVPGDLDVGSLVGVGPDRNVAIERHLDATLGRWLRDRLRPRAVTRALLTDLALALQTSPAPSGVG